MESGDRNQVDESGATETLLDTETPLQRGDESMVRPGEAVGRYTVLDRIGSGAMGIVFAAYDPELDRRVALKLLRGTSHAADVSEGRARLLREAQALARLSHPNVVAVHDVGTHQDQVFVAMEYVSGHTLRTWRIDARGERRTTAQILETMRAAGRGLAAAHAAGLIHRDFKPDNVMIDRHGRVRVMDFGLARAGEEPVSPRSSGELDQLRAMILVEDATPPTATGALMGTPAYMAPEQHLGLASDGRSDQFAFCVTFWELLYGQRPFVGPTIAALGLAITGGAITEPPSEARAPGWIRKILERGMSSDPADRFPAMGDLLAALDRDPRRRRMKWMGGAAIVGALGITVAVGQRWSSGSANVCAGAANDVKAVWNTERATAIAKQFAVEDPETGVDAWQHARRGIEAYIEQWAVMRRDACEATRVRGEQSDLMMERRMACLDTRMGSIDRALDIFAHADRGVVQNAVAVIAELPAVGTCGDLVSLRRGLSPPDTPALAKAVAHAREILDQARTLAYAGRIDAADRLVADIQAAPLDYAPLRAEVALHAGNIRLEAGDYGDAVSEFRAAFFTAVRAGHDEAAASAAARLVYVLGYRNPNREQALEWSEHAAAVGARVGAQTLVNADVLHALGVHQDASGNPAGARAAYEAAYHIRTRLLPAGHPKLADSLNNIGNTMMSDGDVDRGMEFYERALEIRRASFGESHPIVGASWNNVGIGERDRGDLAKAIIALTKALEISQRTSGPAHPEVAVSANNLARTLIEAGRADDALPYIKQTLQVRLPALGPLHPDTADSYQSLADAQFARGEFVAGLDSVNRALAGHKAGLGESHPTVGLDETTRARLLLALERHPEALAAALRSVELTQQNAQPREYATALLVLAEARLASGDQAGAAETLAMARARARDAGPAGASVLRAAEAFGNESRPSSAP